MIAEICRRAARLSRYLAVRRVPEGMQAFARVVDRLAEEAEEVDRRD